MSTHHSPRSPLRAPAIGVVYASRHGATQEIAERIAGVLSDAGLDARAVAATETIDLSSYDALVLGSAVYMGRWRPEAMRLLRRLGVELASRPLWLFSSGPVGEAAAHPQDAHPPLRIARLAARLHARDHTMFGGRVPDAPDGFIGRAVARSIPAAQHDARDWAAIGAWARNIAEELTRDSSIVGAGTPVATTA